jgi:hypothetical protein
MKLLQKVAVVAAVVVLILSVIALIQGEVHDTAVGVFVSACALLTSGLLWPAKPRERGRKRSP